MSKKKIIHLMPTLPLQKYLKFTATDKFPVLPNESDKKFAIKIPKPPFWVCFFQNDWHAQFANQTFLRHKEFDIECWRPYLGIDKIYEKDINGVIHKVFPANYNKLLGYNRETTSRIIFSEFNRIARKEKVLLHFWGLHSNVTTHFLNNLDTAKVPLVVQHGGSLRFKYKSTKNTSLFKRILYRYRDYQEKKALTNTDHFFVLQHKEQSELSEWFELDKIEIGTVGLNFHKFSIKNKKESKKIIGCSEEKILLLYVGNFHPVKGISIIFDFFKQYRDEFNLELFIIGGQKGDLVFDYGSFEGVTVLERVSQEKLNDYYNAADIYVHPAVSKLHRGTDGTVLEAISCGTPAVSKNLEYFKKSEQEILGKVCKDSKDFGVKLISLIQALPSYTSNKQKLNRRKIVEKKFSWQESIERNVKVYRSLFEKYYSN